MLNLVSFVVPLIGGYWFLSVWNYTRFKVYKDSGYHLFFKSALCGVIFLVFANLVVSIKLIFIPSQINFQPFVPNGFNLEVLLAMILGITLPYILNRFSNSNKHMKSEANNRGNLLYTTFWDAATDKVAFVEVTMASGKVYIGLPHNLLKLDDEYVCLIPYSSGYRDVKTQELKITSHYWKVFDKVFNKQSILTDYIDISDLYVILKTQEVVSARKFYPEIFSEFAK